MKEISLRWAYKGKRNGFLLRLLLLLLLLRKARLHVNNTAQGKKKKTKSHPLSSSDLCTRLLVQFRNRPPEKRIFFPLLSAGIAILHDFLSLSPRILFGKYTDFTLHFREKEGQKNNRARKLFWLIYFFVAFPETTTTALFPHSKKRGRETKKMLL